MQSTITRLTEELDEARQLLESKLTPAFALNVEMADELTASRAECEGLREALCRAAKHAHNRHLGVACTKTLCMEIEQICEAALADALRVEIERKNNDTTN